MRIHGPYATTTVSSAAASRRNGAAGQFTLGEQERARPSGAPSSAQTVGGIDALVALQGLDDPAEKRRRALARGRTALDLLDELKITLLAGTLDQHTLAKLKTAAAGLKALSGDPGLDHVLAEIDLRVEVELAKFGVA